MTVVAVLGMHRSGTSWLAGSLEAMGLALGEVAETNPYNARGNRENPRILALHSSVFQSSGGGWRQPPSAAIWTAEHRAELRDIVAEMTATHRHWGFKDPRAMFVLDGWYDAVPELECVAIFRHPAAVVESLRDRGEYSVEPRAALDLWCTYNERLLKVCETRSVPIMSFDQPPANLTERVVAMGERFGLDTAAAGSFFDAGIRHHGPTKLRLGRRARRVLAALEAAAA